MINYNFVVLHIDHIEKASQKFRLKNESGNYFVSNRNCTDDTEVVVDQGEEVENIYIEKIKIIRYYNSNKPTTTNITFFAIKNGTDKVGEVFSQKEQSQWIKVKANKDGYFMLKDPLSGKFLTQSVGFEIHGNINATMQTIS